MKRTIICLACLAVVLVSSGAMAQGTTPFQASLTPGIAIHDRSTRVEGLTISVWGENPQSALAIGFANGSTGSSAGFSLGFILNYADSYKGIQWGLINYARRTSWDGSTAS